MSRADERCFVNFHRVGRNSSCCTDQTGCSTGQQVLPCPHIDAGTSAATAAAVRAPGRSGVLKFALEELTPTNGDLQWPVWHAVSITAGRSTLWAHRPCLGTREQCQLAVCIWRMQHQMDVAQPGAPRTCCGSCHCWSGCRCRRRCTLVARKHAECAPLCFVLLLLRNKNSLLCRLDSCTAANRWQMPMQERCALEAA